MIGKDCRCPGCGQCGSHQKLRDARDEIKRLEALSEGLRKKAEKSYAGLAEQVAALSSERDRLREELDSLQRWREGILGCEFTRVILRAAEKLSRPECREVDGD